MPAQNVLRWQDGLGWLVLSGGRMALSEVRAAAIERVTADGALVCLSLGNPAAADALLDDMQELGASSGYLVDALAEDDETIVKRVGEAGLVVLSSDLPARDAYSSLAGAVMEGVQVAYERGAVVLAEGGAAAAFGRYIVDDGQVTQGLGWLHDGALLADVASAADSPQAQTILSQVPEVVVVGVGVGSALVLGGAGTVETWGKQQVTITLGRAYTE